jgi:hypothetical protein
VFGFHDHDRVPAAWGEVEGVGDLGCQTLLKLRSAGVASLGDPSVTELFRGSQEDGVSFLNSCASSEAKKSKKPSGSGPALISAR